MYIFLPKFIVWRVLEQKNQTAKFCFSIILLLNINLLLKLMVIMQTEIELFWVSERVSVWNEVRMFSWIYWKRDLLKELVYTSQKVKPFWSLVQFLAKKNLLCLREQWWSIGESTHLSPMLPRLDSQTYLTWVEFLVGSHPCSKGIFSGYFGFPLSSETKLNLIWKVSSNSALC